MTATYRVTCDGPFWTTKLLHIPSNTLLPVSGLVWEINATDRQDSQLLVTIPAGMVEGEITAEQIARLAPNNAQQQTEGQRYLAALEERSVPQTINVTVNVVIDDGGVDAQELADHLSDALKQAMRRNHLALRWGR